MTITVLSPGLMTTIQDLGRPGFAAMGVGAAGAFDRSALKLANRLVGNDTNAAALETLGGGLRITTDKPVLMAIAGASGDVVGTTGREGPNSSFFLHPESPLEIRPPTRGLRTYLSFRGGLAVNPVLGSRSWDTLGRIGPAPLTPGSLLPIGVAIAREPTVGNAPVPAPSPATVTLELDAGPRQDWFTAESWILLASGDFTVSSQSDRVGLRLLGAPLRRAAAYLHRSLASEGLVRGAVEVPPDGAPIILGVDHPTTGGYPVIAVVAPGDFDKCAQLLPGQAVRLVLR